MTDNILDNIFELTESEKRYLCNPTIPSPIYNQLPTVTLNDKVVYKFELPNLNKNIIEIRRDSRFTSVPSHIHSNLNINYIYSGECSYIINDIEILLTKGDICIVDRNVIRSKKELSASDIVINISLSNSFFSKEFIMGLGDASILTNFLFSAITQNNRHDGYILFRNSDINVINYFNQLILEYSVNDSFSCFSIESLFSLIFIQLIRNYQKGRTKQILHMSKDVPVNLLNILDYIEKNCENCTLENTARIFNYHSKYLSQLIKNTFGKSFKEIQTEQRLKNAAQYLESTGKSINEICNHVGMTNVTQFYKKFRMQYGMTPSEYRRVKSDKVDFTLNSADFDL